MDDTLEPDDGKKSTGDGRSSDGAEDYNPEQTPCVSTGTSLEELTAHCYNHGAIGDRRGYSRED